MPGNPPAPARYEVRAELGRGGMGVVHAAFDRLRGEEVALKRLLTERFTNAADLARTTSLFEHEFHTLSQLAHPSIIRVFDYGVDALGPFYTMEWLRGRSLRECGRLPWRSAVRAIRDVASALALVHARRLVHRDVTPRNIYIDAEGGGKLIDFGAMVPAGIARQLVGTPAFIAPESLHYQALDGRTDLFALGASLYFALSGRLPYAANALAALESAWRQAPIPLSRTLTEIPEELDELVASLLQLSPEGRPRTAADVYERLSNIADLPRSEHERVSQAYLTTPALVGRAHELALVRDHASRAASGYGASLLLRGAPGMGRSRLLDASLLEARLMGLQIARAEGAGAELRPLGVASGLLQSMAASGMQVESRLREVGLHAALSDDPSSLAAELQREHVVRDLTRVVLDVAKERPLAIGIDDLHSADELSLAIFASLAAQVRSSSLLMVCALDPRASTRAEVALELMRKSSKRISVRELDAAESRTLLSAVFGEVPNLDVLHGLLHARSGGSPRLLMDGAQAVVTAGLVVYEAGSWVISSDAQALGATLDAQTDISRQLAGLSADALELLELLALERGGRMTLADYPALTTHGDSARMHRALNELIDAHWLELDGDRARFRRTDLHRRLEANVPDERRRALHMRLGEAYDRPDIPATFAAYHFIEAGQLHRAIVPMDTMSSFAEANPFAEVVRDPATLTCLEAFSVRSDIPGGHPASRANYACAFIANAMYQGYPERAAARIQDALEEIVKFTGLRDYRELSHLPEQERLMQALSRADERCKQPGIGGLDLIRLIRRQTQVSLMAVSCAVFMADPSLLDAIPDLRPFVPLSPAIGIAVKIFEGIGMLVRGQIWRAWDVLQATEAQLDALPAGTLDPLTMTALKVPVLGWVSSLDVEHGCYSPARLAAYAQAMPHSAASLLARYYFMLGDHARAVQARKESELLSMQSGALPETRNSELVGYLHMYALADDQLQLRRVHAALVAVAKTRPGWWFRPILARAHLLRCRGAFQEALELLDEPMRRLSRTHGDFVPGAAAHVDLLNAAGRFDEALQIGGGYYEEAKRHGAPVYRLELALARAHAERGQHESAEARLTAARHALEERGASGMLLGRVHETGAWLAICRGDAALFAERAQQCAEHYAIHQNALLAARYAKLLRDAARKGLLPRTSELRVEFAQAPLPAAIRELATMTDDSQFYAKALDLLVGDAGAVGGLLYARTDEGLRRVAGTEGLSYPESVDPDREAERYYARALRAAEQESWGAREAGASVVAAGAAASGDAVVLWPCALQRKGADGLAIEGVALLAMPPQAALPASALLEELAMLMTMRGDQSTAAAAESM